MDSEKTAAAPEKRMQLSLRMLLVVVTLFAAFFGWVGVQHRAQRSRLKAQIHFLEQSRKEYPASDTAEQQRALSALDSEIAKRKAVLGEEN